MLKWKSNCRFQVSYTKLEMGKIVMKNRILIIDDAEFNRELLRALMEDDYDVEEACDGQVGINILKEKWNQIDAVLLDLQMPVMDGYQVIDYMKQNNWINKIPILIITGERSAEVENRCFELGVSDFIMKPFDAGMIKNRVKNMVDLFSYKNNLEKKVEEQTATLKSQYQILKMQSTKLRETNDRIVEILGTVVEYRNLESGEHIKRVKSFTKILAEQMMISYPEYGLTETMIQTIVAASALHDVGKIAIPDKILLKPGRLTEEEFEYMKSHTTRGFDMLSTLDGIWDDDYRKIAYEICRHHHERYDGKGYPDGLKGEEIPVSAQIVSVADVYDALVSERVYKNAYSKDEAFHMIINGECGVFSPKLMECFRLVKNKFEILADAMK